MYGYGIITGTHCLVKKNIQAQSNVFNIRSFVLKGWGKEYLYITSFAQCIHGRRYRKQVTVVASGKSNYMFGDQEWRKTFHGMFFCNI